MAKTARAGLRKPLGMGQRRYLWYLTGLLLIAALLRFVALSEVPPGVAHDEVAEVLIAEGILAGKHAIFFREAYGQEPLFLYLVAGALAAFGRHVLALRFVSASIGLLTVAAGARWSRRVFGPTVALITAAGIGVMLWPVFWSRVGLRGMLLPLTMLLGADALWRTLYGRQPFRHALRSGFWFGVSAYTYLAARGVPIQLVGFVGMLVLFERARLRHRWQALVYALAVAGLIALPLILHLMWNQDAQTRVYEVDAPLRALREGNWGPVLVNVTRLLAMFSVEGDASERNNLTLRPVFVEPLWSALFYVGVGVSLSRLRDIRYGSLLVWLGAMSLPSLMTTEAPNFVRLLGALPAVMVFPGVGGDFILSTLHHRRGVLWRLVGGVISLALLVNVGLTVWDYFVRWPAIPEVGFVWQDDLSAVAQWLDRHRDIDSVTVGGLSTTTMDAPSLKLLMRRDDVSVRWCDLGSPLGAGGALVVPGDGGSILVPEIVPVADGLAAYLAHSPQQEIGVRGAFRRYEVSPCPLMSHKEADCAAGLRLIEWSVSEGPHRPSTWVTFTSRWRAVGAVWPDLKIFIHLVDGDGEIQAQHDGLDCPSVFWRDGDTIVQLHPLQLPDAPELRNLKVRVGVYDRDTLAPYPLCDGQLYREVGSIELRRD